MKIWDSIKSIFSRSEELRVGAEFGGGKKSLSLVNTEIFDYLKDVHPNFPLEVLPALKKMALINPDFNQSIKRTIFLGNSGIDWEIEGANEKTAEMMVKEIEDWLDQHPGIINKLYRQVALFGALSAEAIPAVDFSELEEIRQVPVSEIRFQKETLEDQKKKEFRYRYIPFQQNSAGKRFYLNLEQYTYEALETDEDSPYAIPPAISAVRSMYTQSRAQDNVDKLVNKWGLLGFITMLFKRPKPIPGQDIRNSEAQSQELLKKQAEEFEKKSTSGFVATFEGNKVEHHAITDKAGSGFQDVWRANEEQLFSGIDTDGFILGRSYTVTEASAKIAGKLFLLKGKNIRHPVKRFLEKAFTLHLLCKGYRFTSLTAKWKDNISLDPEGDAEAKKISEEAEGHKIDNVLKKLNAGLIDDDQAAKELGYEKATGKPKPNFALESILRGVSPLGMSLYGNASVNTNEHNMKRIRGVLGDVSDLGYVSEDENGENRVIDLKNPEKKNSTQDRSMTQDNVVPIRGFRH